MTRPSPHAVSHEPITRRSFLAAAAATTAAGLIGCTKITANEDVGGDERIVAPFTTPTRTVTTGLQPLGYGDIGRDGLRYVPTTYRPSEPLPLVILLHGAGGRANNWFGSYRDRAERERMIMLAPESFSGTWDAILDQEFGRDTRFIEYAIRDTFQCCAINRNKIALAGFSDGATYALSLGRANGDLFSHLIGYSPGYIVDTSVRGKPKVFMSHGTADTVLPIDLTSRAIVPELRAEGYQVEYQEFSGGHEVPANVSDRALQWFAAG